MVAQYGVFPRFVFGAHMVHGFLFLNKEEGRKKEKEKEKEKKEKEEKEKEKKEKKYKQKCWNCFSPLRRRCVNGSDADGRDAMATAGRHCATAWHSSIAASFSSISFTLRY